MNAPLIVCACRQRGSAGPLHTPTVCVHLLSRHLSAQAPASGYTGWSTNKHVLGVLFT